MATLNISGRPAYMYDQDTDTWYAIAGRVATSANYIWTGTNQFTNQVIFSSSVNCFLNPAERTSVVSSPAIGLLTFIRQDAGGTTVNRFEYWTGSVWTPIADPNAATKNGVETLTNKTMDGGSNTFQNIPQTAISGLATTISNLSTTYSPLNFTTNAQTGTNYTMILSDTAKMIEMNNAAANTLTIPLNSAVAYPIGTSMVITQTGAGQTTLTPTGGVTLNGTPGLKLRTQWSSATLVKRGTDSWLAIGDLSA